MLIIEGPDASGKTTLCHKLLKNLPRHIYAHFSRLPPKFDYYWDYQDRASRYVVQDRFHLSEIVYGPLNNRPTNLPPFQYKLVDGFLRQFGAFTVVLLTDPELIDSRWDPTQMYDRQKTIAAAEKYAEVIHYRYVDVDLTIKLDGNKPFCSDDDVERIITEYQNRQDLITKINNRS